MKKTNLKVRNMKVGWKEDTRVESAAGSMAHRVWGRKSIR